MLPLRFAAAAPFASRALKTLYPGLAAGPRIRSRESFMAAAPDIGLDLGANFLFAGLTGMSLPGRDQATGFEGATLGERAAAAAFDAGTSIPIGMLGRLGGAGLARGIGQMRQRPLSTGAEFAIQNVAGMGAETALWGSGLIQNPATNSALERYNQAALAAQENDKRAYREQILAEAEEEQRRRNQALAGYGGAGAALSPYGFEGFSSLLPGLGGLG